MYVYISPSRRCSIKPVVLECVYGLTCYLSLFLKHSSSPGVKIQYLLGKQHIETRPRLTQYFFCIHQRNMWSRLSVALLALLPVLGAAQGESKTFTGQATYNPFNNGLGACGYPVYVRLSHT